MFEYLSVNYAETTERILKKLGIHTGYELIWVIEYFLSHVNADEAAGRRRSLGRPWREGRRAFIGHFKGASSEL
uniref:SFRICE_016617 n=1 Tax=Spodoptera frugiperda TaxID=7108 RepID=A0A2H1VF54_SPOFR